MYTVLFALIDYIPFSMDGIIAPEFPSLDVILFIITLHVIFI